MLAEAGFEVIHPGRGSCGRRMAEILRVIFRRKRLNLGRVEGLLRQATFEVNLGDIFAIGRRVRSSPRQNIDRVRLPEGSRC